VEACYCPSEDGEFQDTEVFAERCSGESEESAGQLISLPAQEIQ
jgi:hypothetical protein